MSILYLFVATWLKLKLWFSSLVVAWIELLLISKLFGNIKSNCIAFIRTVFVKLTDETKFEYWFMDPPLILNATEGSVFTWTLNDSALKSEESLTVFKKLKTNWPSKSRALNCSFKKLRLPSGKLAFELEYTNILRVLSLMRLMATEWLGTRELSTL